MLKSVEIVKLFDLYSYKLDFSNSENESLKFITGPNGYGKTTILAFINSLCNRDFSIFYNIPFELLRFRFDSATIEIRQKLELPSKDLVDNDEDIEIPAILEAIYYKNDNPEFREVSNLGKEHEPNKIKSNLDMYLYSLSCYYIKDQRLSRRKTALLKMDEEKENGDSVCAVKANSDHLKTLLAECQKKISGALNVTNLVFKNSVDEQDYKRRLDKLMPDLLKYKKFGLINESVIPSGAYEQQNSVFLNAILDALETALSENNGFVRKLDTFARIIDSCEFADKTFQISPNYGFRFVSNNKLGTIIESENLSSGEQHISVLAYELLFRAQDFTIVLIDEPEISFHLMWQMNFLDNLRSIMKLRKLQCIVATHSPQIFSQDWKLSLDLYKLSQNS